jgi:MOSC domain-containing protein YiiM
LSAARGPLPATPWAEPARARVGALSRSARHAFSKDTAAVLTLLAGVGVAGDCHAGETVQHLSRVRRNPGEPNLRQVHLVAAELYDELSEKGYDVAAGQLGENITTRGLDLLGLTRGTRLQVGPEAVLEVTGLRNPCVQIERFRPGLLAEVLTRDGAGAVVRRAGIMSVVQVGGDIRCGDEITVRTPPPPFVSLSPV